MNIIERPLKGGNQFNKPKRIVVHAMGEYIKDPDPIFAPDFLEKYGLSAHALIVPNGDVMMCRDEQAGAYHAKGYNTDSLGVEFLVSGVHDYGSFLDTIKTDYITSEQWIAGIWLVSQWASKWGIERDMINRHSDISPGRKVDPGAGFKWQEFLKQVGG
jgi:N-acetyl-anhydromuramyl-L-alanine amidase AmpD